MSIIFNYIRCFLSGIWLTLEMVWLWQHNLLNMGFSTGIFIVVLLGTLVLEDEAR